ncbi:GNAT family N-acetyltransferase [Solicola sp. PLA-1-18]|uniref:GNAT family N-acetyltransferase n=1 Tax=Solicola sp. PLA-1-18 TaxID=3380532 RepID=UPI003B795ED4
MTDDLRIRRAAETDDGQLAAITYDTWSPQTATRPLPDAAEPFFGAHTGVTVSSTLVAFLPEAVAGFVALSPAPASNGLWAVHEIAVAPLLQRRGVGFALVRAAVAAALSAGAVELSAHVPAGDTAVGRLMLRSGFTATSASARPSGNHDGSADPSRPVTMVRTPLRRTT